MTLYVLAVTFTRNLTITAVTPDATRSQSVVGIATCYLSTYLTCPQASHFIIYKVTSFYFFNNRVAKVAGFTRETSIGWLFEYESHKADTSSLTAITTD